MRKCDVLIKSITDGEYDRILKEHYGVDNLEFHRQRYIHTLTDWGMIYGRTRNAAVYSVPYSVLLAGDGADLAIPTDIDLVAVVDKNDTNIARVRCENYLGEDLPDLFQHGPYTCESGFPVAVTRGVQQAYKHFGYKKQGGMYIHCFDMYLDGFTLPGQGLDEPANMAVAVAQIINEMSFDGNLTEKQIAEIVQYALANYVNIDSYATDVYSTLRGKAVTGDFTNADAEIISETDVDMCGCGMYLVDIDTTDVNLPEEEVDPRLDAFLEKLGKDIGEISEKEFYTLLADMSDVDKEACLFLMDYYTQENFGRIYAANAVDGVGSPSVEKTVEDEADSLRGASVWRCKVNHPYWMTLCCVEKDAEGAFLSAMEKLFGEGCYIPVGAAKSGMKKIIE